MKTAFKTLLSVVLILSFTSCGKDTPVSPDTPGQEPAAVEYYVKYCIDQGGGRGNVSYKIEDGSTTYLNNIVIGSFERTVGPVKKGFEASITAQSTSAGNQLNGRIEVKKGDAPFVVKKEGIVTYGLTYTIDF